MKIMKINYIHAIMRACVCVYACVRACVRVRACAVSSPFQLVLHEGWHGADLHGVGVVGRVLKQTIIRVEQLLGQQEEELPGGPAVVQPDWWRGPHV